LRRAAFPGRRALEDVAVDLDLALAADRGDAAAGEGVLAEIGLGAFEDHHQRGHPAFALDLVFLDRDRPAGLHADRDEGARRDFVLLNHRHARFAGIEPDRRRLVAVNLVFDDGRLRVRHRADPCEPVFVTFVLDDQRRGFVAGANPGHAVSITFVAANFRRGVFHPVADPGAAVFIALVLQNEGRRALANPDPGPDVVVTAVAGDLRLGFAAADPGAQILEAGVVGRLALRAVGEADPAAHVSVDDAAGDHRAVALAADADPGIPVVVDDAVGDRCGHVVDLDRRSRAIDAGGALLVAQILAAGRVVFVELGLIEFPGAGDGDAFQTGVGRHEDGWRFTSSVDDHRLGALKAEFAFFEIRFRGAGAADADSLAQGDLLKVTAGGDEDEVAGFGCVDAGLDRWEVAGNRDFSGEYAGGESQQLLEDEEPFHADNQRRFGLKSTHRNLLFQGFLSARRSCRD